MPGGSDKRTLARGMIVANALSFARVPLAALLWVFPFDPRWTLSIAAVAGLTDVLDGFWVRRARKLQWKDRDPSAYAASSAQGAMIDGFADKVFIASAVLVLAYTEQPPIWTLIALSAREILFIPLMIGYRVAPSELRERVDFTAGILGKAATFAQFAALTLGLLGHIYFTYIAILAGILGAIAAAHYLARAMGERPKVD